MFFSLLLLINLPHIVMYIKSNCLGITYLFIYNLAMQMNLNQPQLIRTRQEHWLKIRTIELLLNFKIINMVNRKSHLKVVVRITRIMMQYCFLMGRPFGWRDCIVLSNVWGMCGHVASLSQPPILLGQMLLRLVPHLLGSQISSNLLIKEQIFRYRYVFFSRIQWKCMYIHVEVIRSTWFLKITPLSLLLASDIFELSYERVVQRLVCVLVLS